jgi:hypothetical protein
VADPELRLVLGEQLGNAIDRGQRLLLVEVEGRDDLVIPHVLEVHEVAGEDEDTRLRVGGLHYRYERRAA